jgi:glutamate formiminotransferase
MDWLESVPNVSEGRDAAVVRRCAAAIARTGAHLLDVTADPTHHRSVYTFAGPAPAVTDAVLALFAQAIADVDLRRHTGAHPRIGAVDVVPFVPVGGVTMAQCVELARTVGAEVARRFDIPVFLYEAAATADARRRLEDIRRGGLAGLTERMHTAAWAPDFGPAHPHPSAGASAIGARPVLIAYNVNLSPARLDVAARIAARVRERSGGLPAVKAMAVNLVHRGLAQVSMNLTDFRVTPPLAVFERVSELAAAEGVEVVESELIGLIPAAALPPSPAVTLKLHQFTPACILENRIARAQRTA